MDMAGKWQKDCAGLLGKRVRVTLDHGGYPDPGSPSVIVTGQLLGFADSGEFEILMDDGFTHYAWPMLDIEEETGTKGCG